MLMVGMRLIVCMFVRRLMVFMVVISLVILMLSEG